MSKKGMCDAPSDIGCYFEQRRCEESRFPKDRTPHRATKSFGQRMPQDDVKKNIAEPNLAPAYVCDASKNDTDKV